MEDKFYAVIDTNVIVSAVISKSLESNPAKIIRATRDITSDITRDIDVRGC